MVLDPTDLQVTALPTGDMAAGGIHADGTLTAAMLRPDGRTYLAVLIPHGFHGPRLRDVIRQHVPAGSRLHMSRTLADDPTATRDMTDRWAYALSFDTTDAARDAA